MNLEKFLLVSETISEYVKNAGVLQSIGAVADRIDNQINQPNDSNLTQLSTSLSELEETYKDSQLHEVPQTWAEIISQFGIGRMLDPKYPAHVRNLISESEPLLNEARDEIREDHQKLNQVLTKFREVGNSFQELGIKKSELVPGEAELSVLFPRELFSNEVRKFTKDINFMERFISVCSEVANGEPEHAKLKQVSTTDPIVFMAVAAPTVLIALQIVNEILGGYQKIVEIRKAKKEVEMLDVDKSISDMLEDEASNHITVIVNQAASNVRPQIDDNFEEERSNELEEKVKRMTLDLARKIDHGMRVEGWAGAAEDEETEEEATENGMDEIGRKIRELARTPQRFVGEGEPVLRLPPPENEGEEE